MKILLRASASPRAARPPRLTSVPIKHRNRKKPNFIIIFRPAAAARPLRLRLAPGSPKEIRAPALPPPAYLGKPRATALYSTQAQARRISTALPQSRCPYLNHIPSQVRCGCRYILPSPSVLDREIISQNAETATVEAWRGRAPRTPTRARHARYKCAPAQHWQAATGTKT